MSLELHSEFRLQKIRFGREQAPLVVIDNLVENPQELVDVASSKMFGDVASYYPGVRAKVPLSYQHFIVEKLRDVFGGFFGLSANSVRVTSCHYSLVTTPPAKLTYLQRIPHVDSLATKELAFIHYLFKANFGGTAFYRHRATGFEYVDQTRKPEYWRHVEEEQSGLHSPHAAYIDGDTPLYEQIGRHDGVYNRLLIYRRNSLHSGDIRPDFLPSADPRLGRLSINGFVAS